MYCRLNHHIWANSILATEQYGFRKGHSTEHATFSLTDNILMVWNKKIHIGGILASDCGNHYVLIDKVKHYGIQESTLNWFKSYPSNRRQRTKLSFNKDLIYYSTLEIVKQGVLQGSVLGLLFFYYIHQ